MLNETNFTYMRAYAHHVASAKQTCTLMFATSVLYTHLHMHGAQQHLWMHAYSPQKCIWTRACAPMQLCRSFYAMEAIANLSWVLCEHRAGCRLPLALAAPSAVSDKPVARRCSLKKSVQIHASSWRDRRCGVAQHHPIICVGAGLIHFVYESHSHLATEGTRHRNAFSPFSRELCIFIWLLTTIYP